MSTVDDLRSGKIKLREIEKHHADPKDAALERRQFVASERNTALTHIGNFSLDLDTANQFNAENIIGVTQVPLGVTDPLQVNGEYAKGTYYIPLATTEKSLIAGISRGCKAITLSGGAQTWLRQDQMSRAPLFKVRDGVAARALLDWVSENFSQIEAIVKEESSHSELTGHRAWTAGRNVFIQFLFSTGDAMGMNMVTRACDKIGTFLAKQLAGVEFISVSGNMCIDKKPAAMNLLYGRGKSVSAEVLLSRDTVVDVLKTTPEAMADMAYRKNLIGSAYAGSYGFNAHFANMIAAIFIATGQDPAHTVEGALGFSLFEMVGDDLHASVTLPALEVATVGGGTRLETQAEALSLLDCLGSGEPAGTQARKFAEIVAATVLAGEISLIAAETAHHLAEAHRITRA